ncbi:MAG: nitrate reductase cytochrome c-type subunit [Phycisphaerae bacterium]
MDLKAESRCPSLAEPLRVLPMVVLSLALVGCFAGRASGQREQPATDYQGGDQAEKMTAIADESRDKLAALAERAKLRAYFGAPPVIPHEIDQFESAADCLACHGHEPTPSDETVPKIPHAYLASCTQCHVEQEVDLFVELELAGSGFRGLPEPTGGHRAWPGAPPTIPHSTLMRNDCLSCHGTLGRVGIRSSHPERRSCQQCHAPTAQLNQCLVGD